jgi:hypothetical protein
MVKALHEVEVGDPRGVRVLAIGTGALLRVAQGNRAQVAEDEQRLRHEASEAERVGCENDGLQARLALGRLELAIGNTRQGRADLQALARDAKKRGFLLVARQALAT